VYEAAGALRAGTAADLLPALPAGILAAGTTGWLSIRWLINFVSRDPLYVFAVYCAVVGAICLVLLVS
jgi:undecaprenyl pyrophosphate phosphatase UppP